MKKILIFFSILCISSLAFAHPPSKIEAEYISGKEELNINIMHPVYDSKTHFIKKVTISKNGKEIISENMKEQQSKTGQELQYVIRNLEKGDKITVKAVCNVYGTKAGTIIIQE